MFQPQYRVSPSLLDTIKRITILIHELNKQRLSEVVVAELLSEAVVTSSYASTSIEGNPLPLTEVRRILKHKPAHIHQSEREVLNYNQVLTQLNEMVEVELEAELLLTIHRGVMQDLLPVHRIGAWRQEPGVVYDPRSGGVTYLPPDHQDVARLMVDLINFVQKEGSVLDPLLLAGIFHKQFVIIHPFMDGNGRTARLATKMLLAGMGVNLFNLLSFENYYNRNIARYFQGVGVFGNYYEIVEAIDFTPWLEYFAEGILDELRHLEDRITRNLRHPNIGLQAHHHLILDYIDRHGFITDRDYAQLTERAKATRSLDFKKLLDLGLIERQGRGRSTYYQRPVD